MAREELVSSAVTFLQDPSVSTSPIDKRIAFLQSKNLTQEEIDLALARASEDLSSAATTPSSPPAHFSPQNQVYRQPPQYPGTNFGYGPYGGWQPPPPEVPKRDWRDWFIMATVMGGVSYGLYFVAKRYIAPIISPPTPPQLQQDKETIDTEFARAFALLDQLSADTATLKTAEEARTERLDATLREVESVVSDLKQASRRREDEARRIGDELKNLKEGIPRALDGAKESSDKRLKELSTELRSLKTLMGNRLGPGPAPTPSAQPVRPTSVYPGAGSVLGNASSASLPTEKDETMPAPRTANGTNAESTSGTSNSLPTPVSHAASVQSPRREATASPFSSGGSSVRRAAIPEWQMAAANANTAKATVTTPGAQSDGADGETQGTIA